MNDTHNFKLIVGDFSVKESLDILQSIYAAKIQFHQMNQFSSMERFGKEDAHAVSRIPELKKSIERIKGIILEAEERGERLEIHSDVTIRAIKPSGNME